MSQHVATISWRREGAVFTDKKYSRAHRWRFDGGLEVPASSAPGAVRPPLSDPAAVDPEEALVAALSSCHMLWFLALAASGGFVVDAYEDEAAGTLAKDADGKMAITEVVLRPKVTFAGERQPTGDELDALHHESHERCYIASSVKSAVRVEVR